MQALRQAYDDANDEIVPLTKEALLEELTKPKYSVIKVDGGGFTVDGELVRGLTHLVKLDAVWSDRGGYAAPAAKSFAHQCMTKILAKLKAAVLASQTTLSKERVLSIVSETLPKLAPVTPEMATFFAVEWYAADPKLRTASFHGAWSKLKMYAHMGSQIDRDFKAAVKMDATTVQYFTASAAIVTLLDYGLEPVAVDVNVTTKKDPTKPFDETLCAPCMVCAAEVAPTVYATEIDVVCFNPATNKVCLVELKCTRHRAPAIHAMKQYQTQAWLTWLAFSNTYPQLRRHSESVILTASFQAEGEVCLTSTAPRTRRHTNVLQYPFIRQWCSTALSRLCPVPPPNVNPWTLSCKIKTNRCLGHTLHARKINVRQDPREDEELVETFHELCDN